MPSHLAHAPQGKGEYRYLYVAGEGNGTHSSILAWRIPWTEEPGESVGSQGVGHNRGTNTTYVPETAQVHVYASLYVSI